MAKVNLIGVQPVEFTDNNGKEISGLKLHISYQDDSTYGYVADSKFVTTDACKKLSISEDDLVPLIGQVVDLELNPKGKLVGINPA